MVATARFAWFSTHHEEKHAILAGRIGFHGRKRQSWPSSRSFASAVARPLFGVLESIEQRVEECA